MQIRQNDRLANLPPEDRAKLDSWLRREPYRRVITLAAAPRPDGLALRTNIRALSRYYNKFIAPSPTDELAELALHNPAAAHEAALAMIQTQAIQMALKPAGSLNRFGALSRFLFRQNSAALRNRELDIKEKIAVLKHLQSQPQSP